jgi:hypothetical protein
MVKMGEKHLVRYMEVAGCCVCHDIGCSHNVVECGIVLEVLLVLEGSRTMDVKLYSIKSAS